MFRKRMATVPSTDPMHTYPAIASCLQPPPALTVSSK